MEHTSPCAELIDQMQITTKTAEKLDSTHEWTKSLDGECEKIKIDINRLNVRIAVLSTAASFLGGMLGGWAGKAMQNLSVGDIYNSIVSYFI